MKINLPWASYPSTYFLSSTAITYGPNLKTVGVAFSVLCCHMVLYYIRHKVRKTLLHFDRQPKQIIAYILT